MFTFFAYGPLNLNVLLLSFSNHFAIVLIYEGWWIIQIIKCHLLLYLLLSVSSTAVFRYLYLAVPLLLFLTCLPLIFPPLLRHPRLSSAATNSADKNKHCRRRGPGVALAGAFSQRCTQAEYARVRRALYERGQSVFTRLTVLLTAFLNVFHGGPAAAGVFTLLPPWRVGPLWSVWLPRSISMRTVYCILAMVSRARVLMALGFSLVQMVRGGGARDDALHGVVDEQVEDALIHDLLSLCGATVYGAQFDYPIRTRVCPSL